MTHISADELRRHYGPRKRVNGGKASRRAYVDASHPTPAQEQECDALQASGESLRAAVAWRLYSGKGDVLSAFTGVPYTALTKFVETGELGDVHRLILEAAAGS